MEIINIKKHERRAILFFQEKIPIIKKHHPKHYFYGWYYRCQTKNGTAAVIPAVHISPSKSSCSIQVITEERSYDKEFPIEQFHFDQKRQIIRIGENVFSQKGFRMKFYASKILTEKSKEVKKNTSDHRNNNQVKIEAKIRFGSFAKPKYDMMGPFALFSKMQCRHTVYSMSHTVNGFIKIGEKSITFHNAMGYMEGDSGSSFPDRYLWTQHFIPGGSVMFAVATIPFAGIHFTGTLGYIFYHKKEYRFATYLGATVKKMNEKGCIIRQGHYTLRIRFLPSEHTNDSSRKNGGTLNGNALRAPDNGKMSREIIENVSCPVEYALFYKNQLLFHGMAENAAMEYDGKIAKRE